MELSRDDRIFAGLGYGLAGNATNLFHASAASVNRSSPDSQAKILKSRSLLVVWAATLLFSTACQALQFSDTPTDLRLTLSEDFIHASGSTVLSGRYGGALGARAGSWTHTGDVSPSPRMFVGVDYVWTLSNWRLGLGTVWIRKTTSVNGTHWNFDASLAYNINRRLFIEYRHYSHARQLGIEKDVQNGGWNLIGLGVTF